MKNIKKYLLALTAGLIGLLGGVMLTIIFIDIMEVIG